MALGLSGKRYQPLAVFIIIAERFKKIRFHGPCFGRVVVFFGFYSETRKLDQCWVGLKHRFHGPCFGGVVKGNQQEHGSHVDTRLMK